MIRSFAAVLLAALLGLSNLFGGMTELNGADMGVDVPDGWLMLTRSQAKSETNAAMFGMTVEEAVRFMEENNFYLVLYEPQTSAEIYVTIFGSDYATQLRNFEWLTDTEMALAIEDMKSQYTTWVFDGDVKEEKLGNFTYLAARMHSESSEKHMESRQLFTVYDGLEIYIDLYAGESGLQDQQITAQDQVAQSLQVNYLQHKAAQAYKTYVALMVCVMVTLLIQFVGLAMALMIRSRMKAENA